MSKETIIKPDEGQEIDAPGPKHPDTWIIRKDKVSVVRRGHRERVKERGV